MNPLDEYPQIEKVLRLMDNLITNEEMSRLNFEVETNGKSEREVAINFLKQKGSLE